MMEFVNSNFIHEAGGLNVLGKFVLVIITLIISIVLVKIFNVIVNRVVRSKITSLKSIGATRLRTVMSVLKSMVKGIILFTWFLSALKIFGVNTSAILTTAGIGGIAISFGAKSLVEDLISGVFITIEDSFGIGDFITVAGKDGEVQRIGLRTTTIKDFNGELHVIPNGEIRVVTNRNKNVQRSLVQFPISYDSDLNLALEVLQRELPRQVDKDSSVIEPIDVMGITGFITDGALISVRCRTIPGEQWRIERLIRQVGYNELTKNGIEILHNSLDVRIDK